MLYPLTLLLTHSYLHSTGGMSEPNKGLYGLAVWWQLSEWQAEDADWCPHYPALVTPL